MNRLCKDLNALSILETHTSKLLLQASWSYRCTPVISALQRLRRRSRSPGRSGFQTEFEASLSYINP